MTGHTQYQQEHDARLAALIRRHRRQSREEALAVKRAAYHRGIKRRPPATIEQLSQQAEELKPGTVNGRIGRLVLGMSVRRARKGVDLETAIRDAVGAMEAMMHAA